MCIKIHTLFHMLHLNFGNLFKVFITILKNLISLLKFKVNIQLKRDLN